MKKLLFLLLITGIFASCKNKESEQRAEDDLLLQGYFTDNGIDAKPIDNTGVYYQITEEGDNLDFATPTSIVRAFYKGYLLDGSVFDERVEGTHDYLESYLGNMVYGWQVGMTKFSKGAKGQLFIPSHAGYGELERQGIPENSILIFDIHLVNFF